MTTLSTLFHLHITPLTFKTPQTHQQLHISCHFKPKTPNSSSTPKPLFTSSPIPARDRVIDFGKHKGKMLGTLPSTYLRWVSKNLRARDFEDWAKLADQVLDDAVYRDRIEWELAENALNGNRSSSNVGGGGVSELVEISERFGWDNEDKIGWSRVNFELLGTSKGGRIPRLGENGGKLEEVEEEETAEGLEDGSGGRRRERRVRLRMKMRSEEKFGILEKGRGILENGVGLGREKEDCGDEDRMVENNSNKLKFPGRESLLKKAYSRRMRRFS